MLFTSIVTGNPDQHTESVELRQPAIKEGMMLYVNYDHVSASTLLSKEQAKILRDELTRYVDDPESK